MLFSAVLKLICTDLKICFVLQCELKSDLYIVHNILETISVQNQPDS